MRAGTISAGCLQPGNLATGLAVLFCLVPGIAAAQQVTIATPQHNVQHGFFERQGVNFGFSLPGAGDPNAPGARGVFGMAPDGTLTPNINFSQGGFNNSAPQFGGYDPANSARGGVALLSKNGNAFFNFEFGQGSTRTHSMQAPVVTLMNGQTGSFQDTSQFPFVTGVTPVVNQWAGVPPVVGMYQRLQAEGGLPVSRGFSDTEPGVRVETPAPTPRDRVGAAGVSTAGQHAASIADIRREQEARQAEEDAEALALFERGLAAESEGREALARNYYRIVARQAGAELRAEAAERLRRLQPSGYR